MSIAVCCSQCGRMIYCSADNVDKRIACPGCGCIIETPHATFELSSGAEPTAVPCPCCGAVLRLMSSFAGKRVFCVSCNSALTISIDVLGILRIDKAETSPPTPTISRTDGASATTSGNLVYVSCSCGREVKFARTVVRDHTRCPSCGSVVYRPHMDLRGTRPSLADLRLPAAPKPKEAGSFDTELELPETAEVSDCRECEEVPNELVEEPAPVSEPLSRHEVAIAVRDNNILRALQGMSDDTKQAEIAKEAEEVDMVAAVRRARQVERRAKAVLLAGAAICVAVTAWMAYSWSSSGLRRLPIHGTVSGIGRLGGEITFLPMGPPDRPTASTRIEDGQYFFDRETGPCSGLYKAVVALDSGETPPVDKSIPLVVPEKKPWDLEVRWEP